jgi:hypothetical protein
MNTLTSNRIIEKGDEYRDNGTWRPVPDNDIGLQIAFTKYSEVRRPSETLRETPETAKDARTEVAESPVSPTPISLKLEGSNPPVAAEGEQVTPHRVAPVRSESLPTVVSKKAHTRPTLNLRKLPEGESQFGTSETERIEKHTKSLTHPAAPRPIPPLPDAIPPKCGNASTGWIPPKTKTEKATAKAKMIGKMSNHLKIKFPKPNDCIWTGRNGSFNGYGLDAMVLEDKIMLFPIGKRGVGNCTIQFPTSTIPELVDWLLRQQPTKTP